MVNTVFILNDQLKIERFSKVFKNDKECFYAFFSNTADAVEYVKQNPVDIAIISVSLGLMDGGEIAELISDVNPACRYIFSFSEMDTEEAVDLFNIYDSCRLLEDVNCEPENLKYLIQLGIDSIAGEEAFKEANAAFREKERSYKKKMAEMSSLLNARVTCYSEMIKLLSGDVVCLFDNPDDESLLKVVSFFEKELNEYIRLFLDRRIDNEALYASLTERYNAPDKRRLFSVNKGFEVQDSEADTMMLFTLELLCDAFLNFTEAYRGKVVISEEELFYKLDVLFDIRAGHPDAVSWDYTLKILGNILKAFSAKSATASKDGIMQFRLYFDKNSHKEELQQ